MTDGMGRESIMEKLLKSIEVSKNAFDTLPVLTVDEDSENTPLPPGFESVFLTTDVTIEAVEIIDEENIQDEDEDEN